MDEVSWGEFDERVGGLEEKVEKIVDAMKTLSRWVDTQQSMNDDETILFDSLNERVLQLESHGLKQKANKDV